MPPTHAELEDRAQDLERQIAVAGAVCREIETTNAAIRHQVARATAEVRRAKGA